VTRGAFISLPSYITQNPTETANHDKRVRFRQRNGYPTIESAVRAIGGTQGASTRWKLNDRVRAVRHGGWAHGRVDSVRADGFHILVEFDEKVDRWAKHGLFAPHELTSE
jgi:hypothetical protein